MSKKTARRTLGPLGHRQDVRSALFDDPEIGHTTLLVLNEIQKLGSEAYGKNILDSLCQVGGVWLDQSQIYSSMRKLRNRRPALIEFVETRESPGRGPPYEIYRITKRGEEVLLDVTEHHVALAEHLTRYW